MWAAALLCVSALGDACASITDGAACIASLGGGLL